MATISKGVIIETRDVLLNYLENATEKDLVFFSENPIKTLKELGISLVNRISPRRLSRLSNYIRIIIDKVKSAVREWRNCAACKIALKLIFFAFATMLNVPLISILNHYDFVQLLVDFFNQTTDQIITYLSNIGITFGEYNLFEINDLIERLCSKFGPCS